MISKTKLIALAVASLSLCSQAFAQCTDATKDSLLSCYVNGNQACRAQAQFATCDKEPEQGISIQDVLTSVTTECCRFTGRTAKSRARACFTAAAARFAATTPVAHKSLRNFSRATRAEILALRSAGCTTGSN